MKSFKVNCEFNLNIHNSVLDILFMVAKKYVLKHWPDIL
jgi:hypothetical protein